jgi:hypothetical protein
MTVEISKSCSTSWGNEGLLAFIHALQALSMYMIGQMTQRPLHYYDVTADASVGVRNGFSASFTNSLFSSAVISLFAAGNFPQMAISIKLTPPTATPNQNVLGPSTGDYDFPT